MATTKQRINITLPDSISDALIGFAKRDHMPRATKAAELLKLGLEIEEDRVWDDLARKRDTKGAKYILHDKVWA